MDMELAIIGAGSAGYAAGIYAGRAGIDAVIFDAGMGGGFYEEVNEIKKEGDKFKLVTSKGEHEAGAVIICTGTVHKKLDVKGEKELAGRGVSYCATCDGFFFKDKKVVVVGGGNSAVAEALYLHQVGCDVSIIHRRDVLRAEKMLGDEAIKRGIKVIWNSVVEEIVGKDKVEGVKLKNVKTGEEKTMPVDGVFISVGEVPKSEIAKRAGVETDDYGYIKTDDMQRTNVKGIYAAGDVTGGVRQIITACAEGAKAALASTEVLGKMYPF